jgi:hypothetical protein
MEIEKMLTVSVAHITQETAKRLDAATNETSGVVEYLVAYRKNDYGWFVYADEDYVRQFKRDIPADLYALMMLAAKNDCTWLCLDCDGDEVDGLPTYDW